MKLLLHATEMLNLAYRLNSTQFCIAYGDFYLSLLKTRHIQIQQLFKKTTKYAYANLSFGNQSINN